MKKKPRLEIVITSGRVGTQVLDDTPTLLQSYLRGTHREQGQPLQAIKQCLTGTLFAQTEAKARETH